jgi:hypothetical protein
MDNEQLEEWMRVQNEKSKDYEALLSYTAADESKIRALSMEMEILVVDVNNAKK